MLKESFNIRWFAEKGKTPASTLSWGRLRFFIILMQNSWICKLKLGSEPTHTGRVEALIMNYKKCLLISCCMAICPQHTEINLVPSPRALPGSAVHNKTLKPASIIMPAMFRKGPHGPKL